MMDNSDSISPLVFLLSIVQLIKTLMSSCRTLYVYNSHNESIEFLGKLRTERSVYTHWAAKQRGGKEGLVV
jgi:hypothetical protein